jgi:uroporphyrinogen-III synthase
VGEERERLIVGVDVDGTITKHSELFRILCKALRKEGCSVHIVTCRLEPEFIKDELRERGIEYDKIHAPEPETDHLTAAEWKAKICQEEGITVLFDDSPDIIVGLAENTQGILVL